MPVSCLAGYDDIGALRDLAPARSAPISSKSPHNGHGQAHHVGPEPDSYGSGFNTESVRKLLSDDSNHAR